MPDTVKHIDHSLKLRISGRPRHDPAGLCIVIPCYNESKKLNVEEYSKFLRSHPNVTICFVNDGSTDQTLEILQDIRSVSPEKVAVISLEKNKGKATAVRTGILHCLKNTDCPITGYLDADLAVSLDEYTSLASYLQNGICFCFGSRILKIGSEINRKRSRFLIGRVMATIISLTLDLKVYDTQCGCKLFTRKAAGKLFAAPFISRWLFDVEIFFRVLHLYGKEKALCKMMEIPVVKWVDKGDSKVKASHLFRIMTDLVLIRKRYRTPDLSSAQIEKVEYTVIQP